MTTTNQFLSAKLKIIQPTKVIGIPLRMFNTKITVKNKATTKDDTGGLNETFTSDYVNIPGTIQPLTEDEVRELQGTLYNYTHRGFLPKVISRENVPIEIDFQEGSMFYDQETEESFRVKLIDEEEAANVHFSSNYYYFDILLEKLNDDRYD